jgi:ABC-2 type transport system ATP-binding protein
MHEGRRLAAGPVAEIISDAGALMVGTPEPEHAVAVLRAMDGIEGAEPHPDGVLVRHDGVPPSTVVAALVEAGVPVDRVGPSRRLEDAFLALIAASGDGDGAPGSDGVASPASSDLVSSQGGAP